MKIFTRIGLFYVSTFVFTIILVVVQQLLGLDPTQLSLPQFGPAAAAVFMLIAFKSDQAKLTITFRGIPFVNYVAALGIPLVVPVLLFLIYNQFIAPLTPPPIAAASFMLLLGGILVGAFGEEVGWRGYAQQMLANRLNRTSAFLITGVLWGVWHIGNFQHGLLYMAFFVLSTIGYSAVMDWLLRGTNYNVVLATLFHFGVNAGFYILQDAMTDIRLVVLNGLVWGGAAVVVAFLNRNNLVSEKHHPSTQPGVI